jgi:signal transduction histidine kinase
MVASIGPLPGDGSDRRLVLGSLSLAFVLIVAAAYGLYRATSRELGLARQQREFVSAVSHEFRTPLTSMRHLTDLLATREGVTDERRAHYYSLLSHETQRLHRMVENLLSFGRIEARAYAWRLESVDIAALARLAVDDFRRDAAASARAVTCEIDDGLPAVRADSDALARAVRNLLENAAKYSEPGTPIDVFVRYAGGSVQVTVGDRGIGIAPEDRARIFDVFVRGTDATRSRTRGVGMGLALVKRIIEAHGGSVKVDSTPGQGSLFTLEIPCPRS